MRSNYRQFAKITPFYYPLRNLWMKYRQIKELKEWKSKGQPDPPPHIVKQKTLKSYAVQYNLKVLIETGTYFGDMVEAMKNVFDHIYSIEINRQLYDQAKKRFHKNLNIELIHGDSATELGKIVQIVNDEALFWLDGHYSAGITGMGTKRTPILGELKHILNSQNDGHVIIIDDARYFGSDESYPTIKEIKEFVYSKRPAMDFVIQNDSIRITPRSHAKKNL